MQGAQDGREMELEDKERSQICPASVLANVLELLSKQWSSIPEAQYLMGNTALMELTF